MKRILILFALLSAVLLPAAEKLPLDEFMQRVRHPNPMATYAALDGRIQHRRSGEAAKSETLYFAVILQPERMTGQIIIGGREGYLIGQTRKTGDSETSVIPMRGTAEENKLLGYMGVRPSDLTMSFLFYPVLKELGLRHGQGGRLPRRSARSSRQERAGEGLHRKPVLLSAQGRVLQSGGKRTVPDARGQQLPPVQ